MIPFLALLLATSLSKASAWEEQCRTFKADSIASVKNLEPTYYPAGSFVNVTSPWSTLTASDLPAFCRLKFDVLTNPETGKTAGAELWLPDGWNTRMLAFGGGGWSGGGTSIIGVWKSFTDTQNVIVPFGPMGVDGVAQGYASYGTDGGEPYGVCTWIYAHHI
jgi:feruloyl esterase